MIDRSFSAAKALPRADDFFMQKSPLFEAAERLIKALDNLEIPFAIMGAVANVPIDILLTGDYPGDGLEKPIAFPRPEAIRFRDERNWPIPKLSALIEFKCASGTTAMERSQDLDDVIRLIRINGIPRDFVGELDPYVQDTFSKLWDAAPIERPESIRNLISLQAKR